MGIKDKIKANYFNPHLLALDMGKRDFKLWMSSLIMSHSFRTDKTKNPPEPHEIVRPELTLLAKNLSGEAKEAVEFLIPQDNTTVKSDTHDPYLAPEMRSPVELNDPSHAKRYFLNRVYLSLGIEANNSPEFFLEYDKIYAQHFAIPFHETFHWRNLKENAPFSLRACMVYQFQSQLSNPEILARAVFLLPELRSEDLKTADQPLLRNKILEKLYYQKHFEQFEYYKEDRETDDPPSIFTSPIIDFTPPHFDNQNDFLKSVEETDKVFGQLAAVWRTPPKSSHPYSIPLVPLFQALAKVGPTPNTQELLFLACSKGDIDVVEILLAANVNPNEREYSNSPLLAAACNGHPHIISLLISAGAKIHPELLKFVIYEISKQREPLITVKPAFQMLLEAGANPLTIDMIGLTPLHIAAKYNQTNLMLLLLHWGALINATDKSGMTPLHQACLSRNDEAVKLLLSHGAKPEKPDAYGIAPLGRYQQGWAGSTTGMIPQKLEYAEDLGPAYVVSTPQYLEQSHQLSMPAHSHAAPQNKIFVRKLSLGM